MKSVLAIVPSVSFTRHVHNGKQNITRERKEVFAARMTVVDVLVKTIGIMRNTRLKDPMCCAAYPFRQFSVVPTS